MLQVLRDFRPKTLGALGIAVGFLSAAMLTDLAQAQNAPLPASSAPAALVSAIDEYGRASVDGRPLGTSATGLPYGGKDCQTAIDAVEGQRWCWSLLQIDTTRAVVEYGVPFTDGGGIGPLTLSRSAAGTWSLQQEGILPPNTGNGTTGSRTTDDFVTVAGIVLLVVATGTLTAARRKAAR